MYFDEDRCMINCNYVGCVVDLNSVIIRGTVHQVKEYVKAHCLTALHRPDDIGRYPIHIAVSCGKTDVLDWILETSKGNIDVKDAESGWTPLHRAMYYGRVGCAVILMQHNANMWIKDKDGCNVLDLMIKDVTPWYHEPCLNRNSNISTESWNDLRPSDPTELYTWGVNDNMTLAHGNQRSKQMPELVEFFARKKISVKQVVLCKYHTLILTHGGSVFSCGNGRGGRLCTGDEEVHFSPQRINLLESVISVSAAIDHSVLVMEDGQVFTCGMNHSRVLGVSPPPEKQLLPCRVMYLRDKTIVGCSVGMCHTAVWTNTSLYTFGTNAGQLGHAKGDTFIIQPRQVSAIYKEDAKIALVDSSDAAIVVSTSQGSVYLLYQYTVRKIISKHMDIRKVLTGGGSLDETVLNKVSYFQKLRAGKSKEENKGKDCKVLILKDSGELLSWSLSHTTVDRCQLGSNVRWLSNIAISKNGNTVLCASVDGTAHLGPFQSWRPGKSTKKSSQKREFSSALELFESDSIQTFQLEQVPCAFRTHSVALGPKARNSAILQSDPRNFLTQVPLVNAARLADHLALLYSNSHHDSMCDVIIRVRRDGKCDVTYPCHAYVLVARSQLFKKLLLDEDAAATDIRSTEVIIENAYPKVVDNVLQLIYGGTCEMLKPGQNTDDTFSDIGHPVVFTASVKANRKDSLTTEPRRKQSSSGKSRDTQIKGIELLEKTAARFVVYGAKELFDGLQIVDGKIASPRCRECILNRTLDRRLFDCEVLCDDSVSFQAHKCVLSSRIPYFQGMLFSPWMESSTSEVGVLAQLKVSVPSDIFRYILDFAYTDSETSLMGASTIESLCEIMAAADLLLMDRLKQVTEVQIVPLLTLKNVVSVIEVAQAFNSGQLFESCLQFTCQNLPALFHTPSFHAAETDVLQELEDVYRSNIRHVYTRVMNPPLGGPCIDNIPLYPDVVLEMSGSPLDLKEQQNQTTPSRLNTSPRRKKSASFSNSDRRRKSGARRSLGVMISDLLNKFSSSGENEVFEKMLCNSSGGDSIVVSSDVPEPKKQAAVLVVPEARKAPSRQKSNEEGWIKPTRISPVAMQATSSIARKTAVYSNNFPTLASNARGPDKPAVVAVTPKGNSGTPLTAAAKPKKLSQKDRRRLREMEEKASKARQEAPMSPPVETPNAWGVVKRSPPSQAIPIWEAPREERQVLPPSPIKSPETNNSPSFSSSPWQRMPIASSVPHAGKSNRASHTVAPSNDSAAPSFIDIVQSEQLDREQADRLRKKPLALIQLEDEAMNELKKHYESSRKSNRHLITVSRVPEITARQILKDIASLTS